MRRFAIIGTKLSTYAQRLGGRCGCVGNLESSCRKGAPSRQKENAMTTMCN
jgi:hypothetical protein